MATESYFYVTIEQPQAALGDPGAVIFPSLEGKDANYLEESEDKSHWEFGFFRNSYKLHNYMKNLYYAAGGTREFDSVMFPLTSEHLKSIYERLLRGDLHSSKYEKLELLIVISTALDILRNGDFVYYDSW